MRIGHEALSHAVNLSSEGRKTDSGMPPEYSESPDPAGTCNKLHKNPSG